jgi:single-stranded-DNA-specific exonuclease
MIYRLRNYYTMNPDYALQEILIDRGVKDIENFLYPTSKCELDPYGLENIDLAADMLLRHLRADSKIMFIVDSDADGVTSSSILWLYIKHIFPKANLNFTMHEHKQHGLDDKIDWLETLNDIDLVICPDSASYDIEEHQRLADIGIDCLVLDHHEQLYDINGNPVISTAPNTIIVNNQLSPLYENKSLCGAGVVYKFCEVLDEILGIHQAQEYMDLVALGEIADVMDRTTTETNYLMLEGLSNIQNKGFQTLLASQSYSLKEKATFPWSGLTPIDVAFYIAPLINALTRVGSMKEKEAMFYCFVEPDRVLPSTKRGAKPGDTETAAEQTARVGKNAKARQDKLKEKAIDLIDFKIQKNDLASNNIILVEIEPEDNIPPELTGLVAMAIVNKYNKPVMIGRRNDKGEINGSIRSSGNFAGLPSFKQFLEESNLMNYVAGHDAAAGFGINATLDERLLSYSNAVLNDDDFKKCYTVDYILDAGDNNTELLTVLASHPEFFGNHIDEIKFVIKNITLSNVMAMGANKDSMKISCNGVDYVRFKDTDFVDTVMNNRMDKLTVYGRANLNTFAGRTSIQVFIDDYELIKDENKYDF